MTGIPAGTVTFLFTDVEGSTELLRRVGERYPELLDDHRRLLRAAFAEWQGFEVDTAGDSFFVAFARAREALSAVLAAQRALAAHAWPADARVTVRMGLHTGEANVHGQGYVGVDVHKAARIAAAAHGGQVLLSYATAALVRDVLPEHADLRDLGEHRLKDLARPERLFQLVAPDLPSAFPPPRTLDSRKHNLAIQPTPLIGREREMTAVRELLERPDVRLVTLTGPGGIGKTRLALQVSAELVEEFADGVYFVNLAPITDPELAASTIAQALDVRHRSDQSTTSALAEFLQARQLLLLLDNVEQIVAGARRIVEELLASCPRLKVLTTSREALHVRGEREFAVPPLTLPDRSQAPMVEQLGQYEAVRLFIERALAVNPDFKVTNAEAPSVAEICYKLDGLPLAIELAAARIRVLTTEAMLQRLEHRLRLLTGGAHDLPRRQQTLRSAIDWSYGLLSSDEKVLFRRLSIFVGGFSLEVAETILDPDRELDLSVLDGVESLIEKSLLRRRETEAESRFFMLETIREYAREQLIAAGEVDQLGAGHAALFLEIAENANAHLESGEQEIWLKRLQVEHDNLRAALEYYVQIAASNELLRLTHALSLFWDIRGHHLEGRRWLERALAVAAESSSADRRLEWKCLVDLGFLWMERDHEQAAAYFRRALDSAQALNDPTLVATSLNRVGNLYVSAGEPLTALRFHTDALRQFEQLGDRAGIAGSLDLLGLASGVAGRLEDAIASYQQAVDAWRALGDQRGLASSLPLLATWRGGAYQSDTLVVRSDAAQAASGFAEAVELARKISWRSAESFALAMQAESLGVHGAYAEALPASRAALQIAREIGHRPWMAAAGYVLGAIYVDLLAGAEARRHLQHALELAQGVRSPLWCAIISRPLVAACILEGDLAAAQAVFEAAPNVSGTGQGLAERPVLVAHVELALARGQGVEALGFVERLIAATPGLIDDLVIPRLWWLRALARFQLGHLAAARADLDAARKGAVALGQRPLLWRIEVERCRQFQAAGDEAAAAVAYESGRSLIRDLAADVPDADLCTQFERQALGRFPREFSGVDLLHIG